MIVIFGSKRSWFCSWPSLFAGVLHGAPIAPYLLVHKSVSIEESHWTLVIFLLVFTQLMLGAWEVTPSKGGEFSHKASTPKQGTTPKIGFQHLQNSQGTVPL